MLSTTDFGAFIEIVPGVEGLVHISELSDRRVGSVEEILKIGRREQFRVLDVDEDERRIRLSLKAASMAPEPEPEPPPRRESQRRPGKAHKPGKPGRPLKGGLE